MCLDRVKDNAVVEMQGCCCGWWHGIAVILVAAVIDRIYLFESVEEETPGKVQFIGNKFPLEKK